MITINDLNVDIMVFSGGEVNITLPQGLKAGPMKVVARLQSSDDVMAVTLIMDALDRVYDYPVVDLIVPYLPYARQDRMCNIGEAHSLAVIQHLLPDFTTYDVHNPESLRAMNSNIEMKTFLVSDFLHITDNTVLVAPDAGAKDKVLALGQQWATPVAIASKVRDPSNGKLSGFEVLLSSQSLIKGSDILIVDDICDGGGTFIGLAHVLKKLGARSLALYTTHGIYSKGLDILAVHFDKIYSTDTFLHGLDHEKLTTIKVV